jgi:hypothetical protein
MRTWIKIAFGGKSVERVVEGGYGHFGCVISLRPCSPQQHENREAAAVRAEVRLVGKVDGLKIRDQWNFDDTTCDVEIRVD